MSKDSKMSLGVFCTVVGIAWGIGLAFEYLRLEEAIRECESIEQQFNTWRSDLLADYGKNPTSERAIEEALTAIILENQSAKERVERLIASRSRSYRRLDMNIWSASHDAPEVFCYVLCFRNRKSTVREAAAHGWFIAFLPGVVQTFAILSIGLLLVRPSRDGKSGTVRAGSVESSNVTQDGPPGEGSSQIRK
jgi:hypothetical protein